MNEPKNQIDPKPFIDRIIGVSKIHADAANQHIIEGNKFEFDVCDLLMKGAGGAIFFYLAVLNLPGSKIQLRVDVLVFFGISLAVGVFHKLQWSRLSLSRANREFRVHAQIMQDLYSRVMDPGNRIEEVLNLWKDISDEEIKYYGEFVAGKKSKFEDFKYLVPPRNRFPYVIVGQVVLFLLGALSIFGVLNANMIFKLWGCCYGK